MSLTRCATAKAYFNLISIIFIEVGATFIRDGISKSKICWNDSAVYSSTWICTMGVSRCQMSGC